MNDIEQPSSSSLPSRSTSNNALDLGSTASNGASNGANNNNSAPSLLTTIRTRLDTIGQGWFNASYLVDWMLCIIVMSLSELSASVLLACDRATSHLIDRYVVVVVVVSTEIPVESIRAHRAAERSVALLPRPP